MPRLPLVAAVLLKPPDLSVLALEPPLVALPLVTLQWLLRLLLVLLRALQAAASLGRAPVSPGLIHNGLAAH